MHHFFDLAFTPAVLARQRAQGSFEQYGAGEVAWRAPDGLGPDEQAFISERDSIYVSSVTQTGWPYVQHRGGPVGFIAVRDATHISWVERSGNRQYVTAGNLDGDDRVAIIAVDYPSRRRLKLLGHATFNADPQLSDLEAFGPVAGRVEGIVTVEVVAFDWNCPKYITPRFTADEVRGIHRELLDRIETLESELAIARR
jgi:predicted pyridoxine 5'-phosphate oxidase superfamily flavin-nucleotide-binding protein